MDLDWNKYKSSLDTRIKINSDIQDTDQLKAEVDKLTTAECIKTIETKSRNRSLPDDILRLIKDRNKARKNGKNMALPQTK